MGKLNITPRVPKTQALNAVVWVSAALLSALTLVSSAVIAAGFGDLVPNEWNVIFLIPKEPASEVSDTQGVWKTEHEIEIFSAEYKNGQGEVIVQSGDGQAVFAPGAETDYNFKMKNNGNVAIDYSADFAFSLKKNGEEMSDADMPLLVRIFSVEKNDYIVGTADTWVPVADLRTYEDGGTLGINSYNEYTLSLKWEYDSGNDQRDTSLGNLSAGESVYFSVDIDTYAEQSADPHAVGGAEYDDGAVKQIGGDFNVLPMATLLTLTACAGAGMSIGILAKANALAAAASGFTPPPTPPPAAPKAVVPPVGGGKGKDGAEPLGQPDKPKQKRQRRKRKINQNPRRWQNHKKNSKKKRSRRK